MPYAQLFAVWRNPMVLYGVERDGSGKANTMFYNRAGARWLTHYYITLPLSCVSTSNLMPKELEVEL